MPLKNGFSRATVSRKYGSRKNRSDNGKQRKKMTESSHISDYFDELKVVFAGDFKYLTRGFLTKREHLRIGLMTGGHVVKRTRDKEFSAACPILFFNFPGEEYCWISEPSQPRHSFFFDIAGARADRIGEMLRRDFPSGFIPCRDPVPFQMILEKLYESFSHFRARKRYRLPMYAEEFLAGIYEEHTLTVSSGKYEKIILAHAERIRRDLAGRHDFEADAAELEVSPIHYRRLFKSVVGVPPYEYLQQCRLHRAIEILKADKSIQIKEISEECGFGNATEFSRFFKQQTGVSPLSYSRNLSE